MVDSVSDLKGEVKMLQESKVAWNRKIFVLLRAT